MAFVLWMTGQPSWKLNQIFSKYLKNDNQLNMKLLEKQRQKFQKLVWDVCHLVQSLNG